MFPHGNIMSSRDLPSVSNKGIQDNDRQNIEYFQALRASPTGQIHEYRSHRAAFAASSSFTILCIIYCLSVFSEETRLRYHLFGMTGVVFVILSAFLLHFLLAKSELSDFLPASEKHRILLYPADITLLSLRGYFRLPPFRKPGDDD